MASQYAAALFIVGLVGLNQAPQVAVAQTLGSGCMFNAPTGANVAGVLFGHVGWAILDAVGGQWYFGATENSQGTFNVPPGGDDQTWTASGTQNDMLAAFMSTAHFHVAGFYTKWRCFNVSVYNVTAALETQALGANSGFSAFDDNCLTKSVAILNAYGNLNTNFLDPSYPKLSSGNNTSPNFYFDFLGIAGWGPVNDLAYQSGTGCMFNAPTGANVSGVLLGHVGWAILDAVGGQWYFGATENSQGTFNVPPGGDDQTWIASGTQSDMLAAFMSAANFHSAGYYTKWRCFVVYVYNVTAALETQALGANSGFSALNDNCLTKSVAILNAYGDLNTNTLDPSYPKLDPGINTGPNFYFDLLGIAGWGPVNDLAYPSGTGCMFNAPTGATVAIGGGQVGWGFLDTGTGSWTFGATENNQVNSSTPSGGDSQSWIAYGSDNDMYTAFKNASYFHPSGYYLWYVCVNINVAHVGEALTTQVLVAGSGYDSGLDNCLTKTVAILSAYGETSMNNPGYAENPNDYFNNLTSQGWGFINVIP